MVRAQVHDFGHLRILGLVLFSVLLLAAPVLGAVQVGTDLVPLPGRLVELEVDLTDAQVGVSVEAPLLPSVQLDIAGNPGAAGEESVAAPAAPPPGTAPPFPKAAGMVAGQAGGAAALGLVATAPALPMEALGARVSGWFAQAREAVRPYLRPIGRALRALPFFVPLFARIGGERLLENPVRARVHAAIAQDPGLSLQGVRERAGVAWGTTVHHLARLERHGLVVSVRHGNHRRFFPVNTQASRHRRELTVLSHPTALGIARFVVECPGTDQKGLCTALGLRNPAASKHLGRFERLGLVEGQVVGRSKVYTATELLHSALALLEAPRVLDAVTLEETPATAAAAVKAVPTHLPLVDPLGSAPTASQSVAVAQG